MSFWKNKKVLVTGHTGFKGSWLCLWLRKLGAEVIGYALNPPTQPSLFHIGNIDQDISSIIGDIRDYDHLMKTIKKYKPEVVFHLAAQPLVRESYINPIETLQTNIIGTANLLDIVRLTKNIKVVINVTSDKCYDNKEWSWGYRETDPMGGYDPYSCSKGCSELITNSFRQSYFKDEKIYIASARAGNVIGGGDWAEDRLVPDIIRSLLRNQSPKIRNPYAVRPWQHVLEPLCGYMTLAEKMYFEGEKFSQPWNFGPDDDHIINVGDITNRIIEQWGGERKISYDGGDHPHEAQLLKLDCSKVKHELGWYPILNMTETLEWTVDWYKAYKEKKDIKKLTLRQIEMYEKLRRDKYDC